MAEDPSHWQQGQAHLRPAEPIVKQNVFSLVTQHYRNLSRKAKVPRHHDEDMPDIAPDEENPVRAAYMSSLESRIASLLEELTSVYKAQDQYTQRIFEMQETLHKKEKDLHQVRDENNHLRRKVNQHNELMMEKDCTVQVLHDEISTLQLELSQIEERNQILSRDNAKHLQRWLDEKQVQANKMNEAMDFYEDMRPRHQAVLNWHGTDDCPHHPSDTT